MNFSSESTEKEYIDFESGKYREGHNPLSEDGEHRLHRKVDYTAEDFKNLIRFRRVLRENGKVGVYLIYDLAGNLLYVGETKDLANRLALPVSPLPRASLLRTACY